MAARLLVVEDDATTRRLLVILLEQEGYEVRAVGDGLEALDVGREFRPHLALIDGGLPGLDGRTVARRLHETLDLAVIFVTGADAPEERREGLAVGRGDYVVKPFDPEELVLRVRNLLGRTASDGPDRWQVGDLMVDSGTRRVRRAGVDVPLTTTEFRLLVKLVRHRGTVMTRRQLAIEVWGYDDEATSHALDVHMSALRRKIEAHGPRLIHTERGTGYVFCP